MGTKTALLIEKVLRDMPQASNPREAKVANDAALNAMRALVDLMHTPALDVHRQIEARREAAEETARKHADSGAMVEYPYWCRGLMMDAITLYQEKISKKTVDETN